MNNKNTKKSKLKKLKIQEKENRRKNKELGIKYQSVEPIILPELDIENITGMEGYRASMLSDLKYLMKVCEEKNEDQVKLFATAIYDLAQNEDKYYTKIWPALREHYSQEIVTTNEQLISHILSKSPHIKNVDFYTLNTAERALVKQQMQSILMEFAMTNQTVTGIDYQACKVCAELAYRCIIDRLQEQEIKYIQMDVAYNDVIASYTVNYGERKKIYKLDSVGLQIWVKWNALEPQYSKHTQYATRYKEFEEASINELVTAYSMYEDFKDRMYGKNLISFNSILANYFLVVEREVIKLAKLKGMRLKDKQIRLQAAINFLGMEKNLYISNELIEQLHEIRLLRNKALHAVVMNESHVKRIHQILFDNRVLETMSHEMSMLEEKNKTKIYKYTYTWTRNDDGTETITKTLNE